MGFPAGLRMRHSGRMKRILLLVALLAGQVATAQPVETQLSVLPGYDTPDGTRMVALRLDLPPGWKTYWRAPGDAGIPPQILLRDAEDARIHWPTPHVFDQNGMRSVGYAERLVLPIELPKGTERLAGMMDIGICREVCVPVQLSFDAALPPAGRRDPAILAALLDQPRSGGRATCRITPAKDGMRLEATLDVPSAGAGEALVIETADPSVWVSEPQIARRGDRLTATARMVRGGDGFAVARDGLRFTLLGEDGATEVRGCTAG